MHEAAPQLPRLPPLPPCAPHMPQLYWRVLWRCLVAACTHTRRPIPAVKSSHLAASAHDRASATGLGYGIAAAAHAADTQNEASQGRLGMSARLVMRGGDLGGVIRGTRLHSRRNRPTGSR